MSKRSRKTVATPPEQPPQAAATAEAAHQGSRIEVLINGVRVEVSPELEAALNRVYNGLTQPLPREMTTTQAAEFLDVSRPFVIKLVKQGDLPCRLVGKHRRIPTDALTAYREKMFQQARKAADEMAQRSQDLGLYAPEGSPPQGQ